MECWRGAPNKLKNEWQLGEKGRKGASREVQSSIGQKWGHREGLYRGGSSFSNPKIRKVSFLSHGKGEEKETRQEGWRQRWHIFLKDKGFGEKKGHPARWGGSGCTKNRIV